MGYTGIGRPLKLNMPVKFYAWLDDKGKKYNQDYWEQTKEILNIILENESLRDELMALYEDNHNRKTILLQDSNMIKCKYCNSLVTTEGIQDHITLDCIEYKKRLDEVTKE